MARDTLWWQRVAALFSAANRRLFLRLATGMVARVLVVGLMAGIFAYVLLIAVWRPLRQPVELPPGVTPTNPALDITLLDHINTQRLRRIERPTYRFETEAALIRRSTAQ